MGRRSAEDRDAEVVASVRKMKDNCSQQTNLIRMGWRENYDIFVNGTTNNEKQEWQTQFSVNKFQTSIRTAQGKLVNILVNTPDWYEIEPRSSYNKDAAVLAPAFQKLMDYYINTSRFKRHAGTFFLTSLISIGNVFIGWKPRLIQNPEYVLDKSDKERKAIQKRLAKNVANPQNVDSTSGPDMEQSILDAIDSFTREAQGLPNKKPAIPPYVQVGGVDIVDINHERAYWDPSCQYMEDSPWRAFEIEVPRYELNRQAKLGFFDKAKVNKVVNRQEIDPHKAMLSTRYKNTVPSVGDRQDMVDLTYYFGPLIEPESNEILKENYWCIIANDCTVLTDGEYPFWEPPTHKTPVVTAAVRQVPYRPTGAGIGDNARGLQKIYDSNWQLMCDAYRHNLSGFNIIDDHKLIDKGQLDEGVYPGMVVKVRGNPDDAFKHIDLTTGIANQQSPVQQMLEQAIDSLTGINELMVGGSNPYSRTSAAETNTRVDAGNQNVNIIALDLEQNFLVPALEKIFARVLQFGIGEIESNPELSALLNDEEKQAIGQLNAGSRMQVLNQWYNFKVKGFSSSQDKNEAAMRDNELLQIINSGGPLSQLINLPAFMKQYFKNRDIKNPDELLLSDSPLVQVTAENQVLMAGHSIQPAETDDHNFHLQQHLPLAQSPFGTPQMQQHAQWHQQMLQQMQAAQAQPGQPPQQGPVR